MYTDEVNNGAQDPNPDGTSSWDRLGGNYNKSDWDFIRVGGKAASVLDPATVYLKTNFTFDKAVNKIVINIVDLDKAQGDEIIYLQSSTDGETWNNVSNKVTIVGDLVFGGLDIAAGSYIRFVFERASSGTKNQGTDIKTITFHSEDTSIVEKVTVTFDLQGGTLEGLQLDQKVTKGDAIADPGNPTKDGHVFIGWRLPNSEENYNFNTAVDTEINLKAHWEEKPLTIDASGSKTNTLTYTFNQEVNFAADVEGDKETFLKALFTSEIIYEEANLDNVTISYTNKVLTIEFGDNLMSNEKFYYYDYVSEYGKGNGILRFKFTLKDNAITSAAHGGNSGQTHESYNLKLFVPFESGAANYEKPIQALVYNVNDLEADRLLDPVYRHEVTFVVNGENYNVVGVVHNQKVAKPNDPVVDEYKFIIWKLNGNNYDFNTKVTSDLEIIAEMKHLVATVKNEAELKAALADTEIIRIEFSQDITIVDDRLPLRANLTIDGKNHSIIQTHVDGWGSDYAFQAYVVTGVTIKNLTFDGGDAAILVNGSEVEVENVTIKNMEFGGIEVSQGVEVTEVPKLTISNLTYSDLHLPTVWLDKRQVNDGWVIQTGLTEKVVAYKNQLWLVGNDFIGLKVVVTNETELTQALGVVAVDIIEFGQDITIAADRLPLRANLTIDGNNHSIIQTHVDGWGSDYAFQAYVVTGVTIKNLTFDGGDAAILVNGSEVEVNNVNIVNMEFGGIEVSQGKDVVAVPKLTVSNLTYSDLHLPTVWLDKRQVNDGWVIQTGLTEKVVAYKNQLWLVGNDFIGLKVVVTSEAELTQALGVVAVDIIEFGQDITIAADRLPLRANLTIDGNNHSIIQTHVDGWGSDYAFQAYVVTGVTIKNLTFDGGDAAILVNGSEVKVNNVNIVNMEFGGIEVSQGKDVVAVPKLTVDGLTHASTNLPAIWIAGKQTNDGWVVQTEYTEEAYAFKNQLWFVDNTFVGAIVTVKNETELTDALDDPLIVHISFDNDIAIEADRLPLRTNLTIDGNNHSIIQTHVEDWGSDYAFQAYLVTGVTIKNLTFDGGDAAILVNGSEVVVENITIKNMEFGGIEVSQGGEVTEVPKLTVNGTFNYTLTNVPPIWIDGKTSNGGWVVQDVGLVEATYLTADKTQLFFVEGTHDLVMTVTFNHVGFEPAKVIYGSKAIKPAVDPTKDGYNFVKWQLNDEEYNFDSLVTTNIALDPYFVAGLEITASGSKTNQFILEFSEDVNFAKDINNKQEFLTSLFTGEVDFTQVNLDAITINYDNVNFKLTIEFGENVISNTALYQIDYVNGDGNGIYRLHFDLVNTSITSVAHGVSSVSVVERHRLKLFVPFESGAANYEKSVQTLVYNVADWEADRLLDPVYKHEVTFVVNGENYNVVDVVHNQKVAKPNDPVVDEYKFIIWKLNGNNYDFNTKVTSDLEIVAEMKHLVATVKNEAELKAALADTEIIRIEFSQDITIVDDRLPLRTNLTIDGKNHSIIQTHVDGWGSDYAFQAYVVTGVTIKNLTFDGGDAAILVNGSEVEVENVSIVNMEFGGIEVSQGDEVTEVPKLTINNLTYSDLHLPTVWLDKRQVNDGWVVQTGLTEKVVAYKNQLWLVGNDFIGLKVVVTNEAELTQALGVVAVDIIEFGQDITIAADRLPLRANLTIDGKNHSIIQTHVDGWGSDYAFQAYVVTGVTIKNLTFDGGDAAILVNGSEVEVENVSIVNMEFGGIEVSQGKDVVAVPKLTVDGLTHASTNLPAIWIAGKQTNDGWVVQTEYTEEAYAFRNQLWFVDNTFVGAIVTVKNETELTDALDDPLIVHISFDNDIAIEADRLLLRTNLTIDGNNHSIIQTHVDGWGSDYAFQAYVVTGVTIKNLTFDGGDAAILVNGSEVEVNNVNIVNMEFGGIEVSQGKDVVAVPKLTVDGLTHASTNLPAIWIAGKQTNDGWVVQTEYTEEAYAFRNQLWFVDNTFVGAIATVKNEAELTNALNDGLVIQINFANDITIVEDRLPLKANLTIDGNNHSIIQTHVEDWGSDYAFQAYIVTGVTIKNLTFDGGDAAILVNGSEVEVENITIKNMEFGGIEVSQGDEVTEVPKLTVSGTFTHTLTTVPPIWIDGKTSNGGWVVQDKGLIEIIYIEGTKRQLFFVESDNPYVMEVTFTLNNGTLESLVTPQKVAYGSEIDNPGNPTRDGYTFVGWRLSGVETNYDFTTKIIVKTDLFATWSPNEHTISFDEAGGLAILDMNVVYDQELVETDLPTTTKEGYVFNCWLLNDNPLSFPYTVKGDLSLVVDWVLSIATVRGDTSGENLTFSGIVTDISDNNITVQDATAAINLYKATKPTNLAVGDKVKVSGTLDEYQGLIQIGEGGTVEIISSNNQLPETVALTTLENASDYMSQLVGIEGLLFVRKEDSNRNIVVRLGNKELVLRASGYSGDIFTLLNTIDNSVKVSVSNSVLNWYNGPQILVNKASQVTITPLTDAEKVELIKADILAQYNNQEYEMGSNVELMSTHLTYGGNISWAYTWAHDPESPVVAGKWAEVTQDELVTATATIEVGETATGTQAVSITIVCALEILNFDLTVKTSGSYALGIGDGEIPDDKLTITGDPTGFEDILTISFYKNNSGTTSIFNNSNGEIRLYGGSGNGGELVFEIPTTHKFNSITVTTNTNNGYTINGGETIKTSGVTTNVNGTIIRLKNVASSTSQVRIKEIKLSIEKVTGETNYAAIDIALIDLGPLTLDRSTKLTLPSKGSQHNSDITWESTNESYINSITGDVTIQDTTQPVTLKATVVSGTFTEEKNFVFSLIGKKVTLQASLDKLPNYGPEISSDLILSADIDGFTIDWDSTNETALNSNTGEIIQTNESQFVKLTATIELEMTTLSREYDLEILPLGGETEGTLVIYEVYGGGGNSGATYTHDYIILYNGTNNDIDLSEYSIQYGSSTTTNPFSNIAVLNGTITSKGYYKIQAASGGSAGAPLPFTPDITIAINLSGSAGKVALVKGETPITNHNDSGVVDFVGFGTKANDYEGTAPAPAPSNTKSIKRVSDQDTDDNNNDFVSDAINLSYLS